MQLYQPLTSERYYPNSHSPSMVHEESAPSNSGNQPVNPVTSAAQPTNSKPTPVTPINSQANPTHPAGADTTAKDLRSKLMAIELGEQYALSLSSHVALNVCTVRIAA